MGVSAKLVDGVVQLTKLMAHGAMHEACLIEVIRTVEDDAFILVRKVRKCVEKGGVINGDEDSTLPSIDDEVKKYLQDDNATVLDLENKRFRASGDGSPSTTEAVKPEAVSVSSFGASTKDDKGLTNQDVKQGMLTEQAKEVTDVKQKINAAVKPRAPGAEVPKEEIKEEVREEMKKLLRRMMSENKDSQFKLNLLKELEKGNINNIDGKL